MADFYLGGTALNQVWLGNTQINNIPDYLIKSDTLSANFNTWDNSSYPGTGTTWTNLVSGGGDFNLVNSPVFTSGDINYFTFNTSSYATGSLTYMTPGPLSYAMMQAWVEVPTGDDDDGVIFFGDKGTSSNFQLGIKTNGNLLVEFQNNTGNFTGSASYNILNQWVNIAATLEDEGFYARIKGYVNGEYVGEYLQAGDLSLDNQIQLPPDNSISFSYKIAQLLVSKDASDISPDVIYRNYYATRYRFE
jgi:hypothetical protein